MQTVARYVYRLRNDTALELIKCVEYYMFLSTGPVW